MDLGLGLLSVSSPTQPHLPPLPLQPSSSDLVVCLDVVKAALHAGSCVVYTVRGAGRHRGMEDMPLDLQLEQHMLDLGCHVHMITGGCHAGPMPDPCRTHAGPRPDPGWTQAGPRPDPGRTITSLTTFCKTHSLSLTHTHSQSQSLSHTLTLNLNLNLSRAHTHTHTHTHTHSHPLTHSPTEACIQARKHTLPRCFGHHC